MKIIWTRFAPPNSVILVEDRNGGEVPSSINNSLVSYTNTCIAIGCLCDADGETDIGIGYFDQIDNKMILAFEGFLETPNLNIAVNTVDGTCLLEVIVAETKTKIEVWANHSTEPDKIILRLC